MIRYIPDHIIILKCQSTTLSMHLSKNVQSYYLSNNQCSGQGVWEIKTVVCKLFKGGCSTFKIEKNKNKLEQKNGIKL